MFWFCQPTCKTDKPSPFLLWWITITYVTPSLDQKLLAQTWPLYFLFRQDRQTLTLKSTCYFDFIEVNRNQDGLKGKPGSRILKTIVAISNFGNRITSTQTFLLSASSEKTKTITTTLRLLFYVSILWINPNVDTCVMCAVLT